MESAMRAFPHAEFEVTWLPFLLNRATPPEGIPLYEYLEAKYGPRDFSASSQHLCEQGRKCGIDFIEGRVRRVYPTILAHRLSEYALKAGKQDALVEEIFRTYFEKGGNISDVETLCSLADGVGLEGARTFLESSELEEEVLSAASRATSSGVHGVPFFSISCSTKPGSAPYTFSGAQPAATFLRVFSALCPTSDE